MDRRIEHAVALAEARPQLQVTEIASTLNLSASHLQHLFKKEIGESLSGRLRENPLRRAESLLRTTYRSVKEISYDVGYQYPPSFVRIFQSRVKTTPKAYRGSSMP